MAIRWAVRARGAVPPGMASLARGAIPPVFLEKVGKRREDRLPEKCTIGTPGPRKFEKVSER